MSQLPTSPFPKRGTSGPYIYIWAIPRKVTYTLHKKGQLIGQPIEEGE